jgi:hypothetical protein
LSALLKFFAVQHMERKFLNFDQAIRAKLLHHPIDVN